MDRYLHEEIMNQPPFNPLKELSEDTSGITHRANERLRKWMEHHNEMYERENCPIGGCDQAEEPIKPSRSNEIKSWGDCIVWKKSKEYMAECNIDWNLVREKMNVWVTETQNPECHHVFFSYNEAFCRAMAKEDFPPRVDEDLIKYHNLGEGWHGFSYPMDNENHLGEINRMLLDRAWGWITDHEKSDGSYDIGLQAFEFGRTTTYSRGVVSPFEGDAYVKFKICQV